MNYGERIISAQKSKKQYGQIFTSKGYKLLREIETFRELYLVMKSWDIELNEDMSSDEMYDLIFSTCTSCNLNDIKHPLFSTYINLYE